MAITEIAEFGRALQYRRLAGLSSDSKPTTNMPIGSTFLETDTRRGFIYDGSNWVLKDTGGQYTTPTHTAPTIGTTTTLVLAANANRLYALLVNVSDEAIYLGLGTDAIQGEGLPLLTKGSHYEMSGKFDNLYIGVINGICASGGKKLLVTEGT